MAIFNSLGSNYDASSVMETLSASNAETNSLRLRSFLEEKYSGKALLVYKGREAIRLALRTFASSFKKDDKTNLDVAICGFTCYAVYEAVVSEGHKVVYLDVDDSLNFTAETLQKAIKNNPKIKILIVQNTLGYAADMPKLAKICHDNGIVIIEDLAHCIGARYTTGEEVGTVGDFTILSFSQDKMIDGVSGGALVVRNKKYTLPQVKLTTIASNRYQNDRMYPLYTSLVRGTYSWGVGKLLHTFLRNANMLSKPMDSGDNELHSLPHWYSYLIYQDFRELEGNLAHRKKIAHIYADTLVKKVLIKQINVDIDTAANLRFPIFVDKRSTLIQYLKSKNIHLSDIWYDAPIGPRKYLTKTNYDGQCPHAEAIAEKIVNLPTHSNITEKDAQYIVKEINKWLT